MTQVVYALTVLAASAEPVHPVAYRFGAVPGYRAQSGCTAAVGEALIRGFCEAGISSADRLSASVRSSERQKKMTSLGVRVFGDATRGGAEELAANRYCRLLVLLKPHAQVICMQ